MVDAIKNYEDQRIKEVLLYILSKTGVVDYYHLMKILYLMIIILEGKKIKKIIFLLDMIDIGLMNFK